MRHAKSKPAYAAGREWRGRGGPISPPNFGYSEASGWSKRMLRALPRTKKVFSDSRPFGIIYDIVIAFTTLGEDTTGKHGFAFSENRLSETQERP